MELITEIFGTGSAFIWGFFTALVFLGVFRFYEWNRAGRPAKLKFRLWDIAYLLIYFTALQMMMFVMFLYLQQLVNIVFLIVSLSILMAFFVSISVLGRVTKQATGGNNQRKS